MSFNLFICTQLLCQSFAYRLSWSFFFCHMSSYLTCSFYIFMSTHWQYLLSFYSLLMQILFTVKCNFVQAVYFILVCHGTQTVQCVFIFSLEKILWNSQGSKSALVLPGVLSKALLFPRHVEQLVKEDLLTCLAFPIRALCSPFIYFLFFFYLCFQMIFFRTNFREKEKAAKSDLFPVATRNRSPSRETRVPPSLLPKPLFPSVLPKCDASKTTSSKLLILVLCILRVAEPP